MVEIFELVRLQLARAFTAQSHYYNLRRRDWRCHIGDRVMKREQPLSVAAQGYAAKLAPKYSGPYTVVKVVSPVVYNLKAENGKVFRMYRPVKTRYQLREPPRGAPPPPKLVFPSRDAAHSQQERQDVERRAKAEARKLKSSTNPRATSEPVPPPLFQVTRQRGHFAPGPAKITSVVTIAPVHLSPLRPAGLPAKRPTRKRPPPRRLRRRPPTTFRPTKPTMELQGSAVSSSSTIATSTAGVPVGTRTPPRNGHQPSLATAAPTTEPAPPPRAGPTKGSVASLAPPPEQPMEICVVGPPSQDITATPATWPRLAQETKSRQIAPGIVALPIPERSGTDPKPVHWTIALGNLLRNRREPAKWEPWVKRQIKAICPYKVNRRFKPRLQTSSGETFRIYLCPGMLN
ncbi:hypothetical protein NQ315_012242 [Exocentrus adspersus]|uniref:Uncharacterized protein n=1 Tax=Exocentrus adspersus TaxID=1586481 RepID=A0AAV8VET7_9CUCU|nr:hypothetical protein NQ315_012242 [Exocentrus adspersus]